LPTHIMIPQIANPLWCTVFNGCGALGFASKVDSATKSKTCNKSNRHHQYIKLYKLISYIKLRHKNSLKK
jgi:hypothetical protein